FAMNSFKVRCPSCSAMLVSSKPLPVGKRVRCAQCKQPFQVAASAAEEAEPPGETSPQNPLPEIRPAATLAKSSSEAPPPTESPKRDPFRFDSPRAKSSPLSGDSARTIREAGDAPSRKLRVWGIVAGVLLVAVTAAGTWAILRRPAAADATNSA